MQATKMLARGGIGGSLALSGKDSSLPSSNASSRQRRINAAASPASSRPLISPRRRTAVSTQALKSPSGSELGSEFRFQRRRLVSKQRLSSPASPAPFALATGLLSTAPAALRASDSDDPSDEEEDDPASELTAEELAMAFSEDVKPKEEEDEEGEEEEEEVEEEFAVAAASSTSPSASTGAAPETEEEAEDDARALALELARVAADTKASDVVVLHVAPLVYWTSYMVLCTVFSRPQLGAVLAKAEQAAGGERFGRDLGGARGAGRSPWEVLDFGDVVMHCFTPDQREFYDLEGFYGAAEEVELPAEVSGLGGAARVGGGVSGGAAGKRDAASWANRA